ncbi:enoyl-CoA hydratase/isomerase family protein [Nocardioides halotolerans]|uniref:enoyl-CoA hydratase/isomerase family protein n=1 Tax=Nocardioides halotolerans TaxID=433660 RepID=UPI00048BC3F0|nr:enoyl-CoA hydratase-related protein [Nocardioides halotolerans]
MTQDPLLVSRDGHVATVTLNRPSRLNALNGALFDALASTWRELDKDDDVRAVVLTGAGDRAFCVGGDLKEFAALRARHSSDVRAGAPPRYLSATYEWEISKPVIGAINGYALAGGFMLALQCDLRVASNSATFGITEAQVGRAAPWSVPLLWAMPSAIALEMLLLGRTIGAERAHQVGLVNEVTPPEETLRRAQELAAQISENAPLTVQAHKRLFYRTMDVGRAAGYLVADDMCRVVYASDDCQEGQSAFAEGRKPEWTGR